MVLAAAINELRHENMATPENIAAQSAVVAKQGLTWHLHAGVLAIFLKSAVVAALALLISCFASSTLFTIVSTFCFMVFGHGQQMEAPKDGLFLFGPLEGPDGRSQVRLGVIGTESGVIPGLRTAVRSGSGACPPSRHASRRSRS